MHNEPAVQRFPHCSGLSVANTSLWVVECVGRIVVRTGAADGCGTAHRSEPACPGREHGRVGCHRGGLAGAEPRPSDRRPVGVERTQGAGERRAGAGRGGRARLRTTVRTARRAVGVTGPSGAAHRPDTGGTAFRGGRHPGGPDRARRAAGRGRDRAGGGGVCHRRGGDVLAVHRRDRRGGRGRRPGGRDAAPARGAGPRAGAGVGAPARGAAAGAGVAAAAGAGEQDRPGRQGGALPEGAGWRAWIFESSPSPSKGRATRHC